ncbi:MAG: hypothetical protein DWQ34_22025 [Planctomycetota bacterium]|nr:MAG: hypothetical protein DWQ34_22025 [Planctomycetota bacterium]
MSSPWESLLDESLLQDVLPRDSAHFARPIRDALAMFLSGLPDEDQRGVLRAQAALPPDASFSRRLGELARSCPVLHKLGQILARDQRLDPELRRQFRKLESMAPTVPLRKIEELLTAELGPLELRGVALKPPAIAEASVAVVIPFAHKGGDQPGVFKILKPGIEARLARELSLLEQVGESLDDRCDDLQIPHLDYRESFQQVREKLADEVQLENEQRHLRQARDFYANEPDVQIPALYDYCTARVTAMERVTGDKVTSHRLKQPGGRRRLAALLARTLIARPVFSPADSALFHGDPHAGNLFLTDEGRLAILDWSLVGRLGETERIAVAQLILGGVSLDAEHIAAVLEDLGDPERLNRAELRFVIERRLKQIRRGRFPGLNWLIGMLDDATQDARLRVGPDLMLFRKSLHSLEGVVAEVGESDGLLDRALLSEFLRHFAQEWPGRWFQHPLSRRCATRLSNLDLTRTFWSGPAATARFWTGHTIDILQTLQRRGSAVVPQPEIAKRGEPCPSSR